VTIYTGHIQKKNRKNVGLLCAVISKKRQMVIEHLYIIECSVYRYRHFCM